MTTDTGRLDQNVTRLCYHLFVLYFYRASICESGLGSRNSVRLSVRPFVTRVDCDKSKWCTADIFIPHETAITLLLFCIKAPVWCQLPRQVHGVVQCWTLFMLNIATEKSPMWRRDVHGPSEWTKIQSGCAISENCSSETVLHQHHATRRFSLQLRVVDSSPLTAGHVFSAVADAAAGSCWVIVGWWRSRYYLALISTRRD